MACQEFNLHLIVIFILEITYVVVTRYFIYFLSYCQFILSLNRVHFFLFFVCKLRVILSIKAVYFPRCPSGVLSQYLLVTLEKSTSPL